MLLLTEKEARLVLGIARALQLGRDVRGARPIDHTTIYEWLSAGLPSVPVEMKGRLVHRLFEFQEILAWIQTYKNGHQSLWDESSCAGGSKGVDST